MNILFPISDAFLFSRFRAILTNPKIVPKLFKLFALTFVFFAGKMIFQSLRFLGIV
jgi:hypothetical protein